MPIPETRPVTPQREATRSTVPFPLTEGQLIGHVPMVSSGSRLRILNGIVHAEEQKEQPGIGKYIKGTISEHGGVREANNEKPHEGVVVGERGDTWSVIDPGNDRKQGYYGSYDMPIDWSTAQPQPVRKEGAEVVPIPPEKAKHVREVQDVVNKSQ